MGPADAPDKARSAVAFVLIDGAGDVGVPELGGRTPLQAARTPVLDAIAGGPAWRLTLHQHLPGRCQARALAGAGATGLMDPVEPGLACGSDTAHLSLFGYDPRRRGPVLHACTPGSTHHFPARVQRTR